MSQLTLQNTTSISQPIAPINRQLSDAVAAIMNVVEMVNGQPVSPRLPSPELRKSIAARLADVRRALVPLRGIAEKERAGRAIRDMLSGWLNAKAADPQAKVAAYVTILQDLPCWAIERVCHDVASGHAEGLDPTYAPSAAQLHQLVETLLERLRKEAADLVTAGAVKIAPKEPTEEERVKIRMGLMDLRDRLERGDDREVAARLHVKAEQSASEMAKQQARVAAEYAAAGLVPPSPLALSLTARSAMAAVDRERTGHLPVDEQAKQAAE